MVQEEAHQTILSPRSPHHREAQLFDIAAEAEASQVIQEHHASSWPPSCSRSRSRRKRHWKAYGFIMWWGYLLHSNGLPGMLPEKDVLEESGRYHAHDRHARHRHER
jgi:hypothetical protein